VLQQLTTKNVRRVLVVLAQLGILDNKCESVLHSHVARKLRRDARLPSRADHASEPQE
jgi:hypothetical protein